MNTAKLFKNGKSQAVRLPKQFKFQGTEVYIKRIGRNVILIPKDDPWESLISSLNDFSDDFMAKRCWIPIFAFTSSGKSRLKSSKNYALLIYPTLLSLP